MDASVFVGPDFERSTILNDINSTQKSFALYIYQVTDVEFCNSLERIHRSGMNVTVSISISPRA